MSLHLIKLCVGAESIEDLERWIATHKRQNQQKHVTRQTPKRGAEILQSGSLYWVIKGKIACRQRILALEPLSDNGVSYCAIVLEPVVIPVVPRPRGPFQGWRYLEDKDAPPDLSGVSSDDMLPELVKQLAELGLL